jgi:hypothetical protein
VEDLIASLQARVRVQFINGATPRQTRQRAIDGFNTSLYAEVIITTPVLAEGWTCTGPAGASSITTCHGFRRSSSSEPAGSTAATVLAADALAV